MAFIQRQLLSDILKHLKKPEMTLIVGARQVGKTTSIELFSKEFDNYIYLNLEIIRDNALFDENLTIDEIFQSILLNKNITLRPGSTLLFIDEIQNSPIAIKMLRYFYEKLSHLHVVSAGSLLEIVLNKEGISFPAGRVEYLYMYPLTFREFLMAQRAEPLLKAYDSVPVEALRSPVL